MPLDRVIEKLRISENLFDVVIFDESSQSDIFSICALMRAKEAVIVGDDKQIGPDPVSIDHEIIQGLTNKYLKNIPQREWFDLQISLYDTALRVFPNRLILKEHFRCLPEIIGFGNKTFYSNEINRLRYPKSYENFYPTIVPIRVKEGYREQNKAINIREAEALVNKLVECCEDDMYIGMTMGIISLLGEQQSQLIENMIRERIGEEEITKRKIVCGTPYAFQGDERDIMFLTMVISKNVKFTPITRESNIRKFNVATSRARNQMWLFYSVDLEDINPECIRYSLLKYCLNYKNKNRGYKKVEYAFMTKFKKEIYESIKNEGYSVECDIKLGQYKIDFVIEGIKNRVAVVCDGNIDIEKYNWGEIIERKLELEKLGWIFCRIRGSEFYYNQEKTMERLWNKLGGRKEDIYKSEKLIMKNLKVV
jgi:superfamily I DNA and/or RNA helicase